MSTFKNIQGKNIRSYENNAPNPVAGEMWYNRTELKLKGVVATGAWTSSASLITGRGAMGSGSASQTAGLVFGGFLGPNTYYTKTEEYNGTGWSSSGELPTTRGWMQGAGTQTAAIGIGGFNPGGTAQTAVYNYNGTSWSSNPHSLPAAVAEGGSAGTQTSAIIYAGRPPSPFSSASYEYDGSSWTSGGTLGTGRRLPGGGGTQTSCRSSGGVTNPSTVYTANSEEYNGTSWSEGPNLNTARRDVAGSGANADSQRISGGAGPAAFAVTSEEYDGTSWTEGPDLAVGKQDASPSMNAAANTTFMAGGYTAADTAPGATEEFTKSANIITAAAWSSGGTLNTARQRTGGFGAAQTSAVTAAGATAPPASALNKTEEYNGTSWTEVNNVNTARFNMTAFGTEPAGVLSGVGTPSVTYGGTTEEYNGTNWTTVNPYAGPGANYRSSNGTQTAGLLAGGVAQPGTGEFTNIVEEYDGTNWSNQNNLPQYQSYANQAGTQTAAINGGGYAGPAAPGPVSANTISLEYDGTNWTAGPNANLYSDQTGSFNGGSGTQTAAMFVGGDGVGTTTYDGTTFATAPTVAAGRGETSGAVQAPAAATVIFAGSPVPSVGGTTLEFTAETTSVNKKNISTS